MVLMLSMALEKRGLKLHPTKCQAQTNRPEKTRRGDVELEAGVSLKVLPACEPLQALGKMLSLEDVTKTARA